MSARPLAQMGAKFTDGLRLFGNDAHSALPLAMDDLDLENASATEELFQQISSLSRMPQLL